MITDAALLLKSYKKLSKELEKQNKIYEETAFTDSLCGIFNRRKFDNLITLEINRSKRYNTNFSIIMFDLDKFKIINDSFGHETGDLVLKKTAEVVQKNIRNSDIFARWGGDEFIILVPGTTSNEAVILAEKLRVLISSINVADCPQLTGSFGIAEYLPGDTAVVEIRYAIMMTNLEQKKNLH